MRHFYATITLGLLFSHFIRGLAQTRYYRFKHGKDWHLTREGSNAIQAWMKKSCTYLRIHIHITGSPQDGPVLFAANHISWLDIVGLSASFPLVFVSKSDVNRWPIIGSLAKNSGTIFIKRGSISALNGTLRHISHSLSAGRNTVIFPEGTTTGGHTVNRFHSGLFEAASHGGHAVQAVSISYRRGHALDPIAPYIDEDTFIPHLFRIILTRNTRLYIHFLEAFDSRNFTRRQLANECRERILTYRQSLSFEGVS